MKSYKRCAYCGNKNLFQTHDQENFEVKYNKLKELYQKQLVKNSQLYLENEDLKHNYEKQQNLIQVLKKI